MAKKKTVRRFKATDRPQGFGPDWVPDGVFKANGVTLRAQTHRPKGHRAADLEVLSTAVQAACWAFAHVVLGEVRRRRIFL